MEQVVLIIHLMLALAIIVLVLLQRSEGGGLGIGGSGGLGGLATPGGAASALSKATSICAFCFFGTSLVLGILAGTHRSAVSILDDIDNVVPAVAVAPPVADLQNIVDEEVIGQEPADFTAPESGEEPAAPLD